MLVITVEMATIAISVEMAKIAILNQTRGSIREQLTRLEKNAKDDALLWTKIKLKRN